MYVCVTYYCVIGCRKEGDKVCMCVSLITELLAVEKKAAGCG